MSAFTIDEVAIPRSIADDSDGVFAGMMAVRNAVEVAGYGIPEVAVSAEEMLPTYLDEHEPKRVLLARSDGAVVGRGVLQTQLNDAGVGWIDVQVHPDHQGKGVGRALADAVEALARDAELHRLITYAVSRDAPGPRLTPPTGFGSVPAGNR